MSRLYNVALGLFITATLASTNAKSQVSEPNSVLVHGEITGEGSYSGFENDKGLFVKLTVTNASASDKRFLIMSCAWTDNWKTDNQNLKLYYPGCDKNVPNEIVLKPRKSILFYGFLTRTTDRKDGSNSVEYTSPRPPYDEWTAPAAGARVRFGFTEKYPDNSPSDSFDKLFSKYDSFGNKTWWSPPVSLQFDNNSFVLEE